MDIVLKKRRNFFPKKRLKTIKIWVYNILENQNSIYNQLYNVFALFLIITSTIGVFIELLNLEIKIPPDLKLFLDDYEEIVLWFFVVEYVLRWWAISDFSHDFNRGFNKAECRSSTIKRYWCGIKEGLKPKFQWMKTPYAIIDLIAILPIIRPLRAIRILRVLRILKVVRYGTAIKSIFGALKEEAYLFGIIFTLLVLWVVTFSQVVYIVEYHYGNQEMFKSMWHAIYWGVVTISTVGFGDIHPVSDIGRLITTIMISGGVIIVATMTGAFSAALVNRLLVLKEGELKMENLEKHIVICGWNETAEEIVEQIISMRIDKEKPVVIVTNVPKKEFEIELPRDIFYKKGDFIHEHNLLEVGIDKAEHVVIVAEREEGLSERNIDARTALAAMLVKNLNPNANIYVEVLLDEDADIFTNRINIKEIIIHGQIIGKIMFSSIMNPGATTLMKALVDKEKGIQKVQVGDIGKFETFGSLLNFARQHSYLPIAIERNGENIVNPPDSFKLEDTDYVFLIPSGVEQ
ncbi:voltage-gated potassium channel [Persephonella hydrogeniphila]|uniref:BK channel n=1 Tax=Persephonella hydrogeniphila TaxID=198703 RepID=A0A285N1N6_9AQUI|nr:ion transporter [Persephonella hydrogeniphila]SNZ03350.1 voltage-gated potassium channel [Persephonella hydrogeniphila]